MAQQMLRAAAPVLKRMPVAASLLSDQVSHHSIVTVGDLICSLSETMCAVQMRSTAEVLHDKHQEDLATSQRSSVPSSDVKQASNTVLKVGRAYLVATQLSDLPDRSSAQTGCRCSRSPFTSAPS